VQFNSARQDVQGALAPGVHVKNAWRSAFAALMVWSCGTSTARLGAAEGVSLEGAFVAVPRALTGSDEASLRSALDKANLPSGSLNKDDTFYLAINKNELGQKWFMSAYLTQMFPRVAPAAFSLGTRVVSFKVQNGKLFVFDVDERKKTSDSANPEVIVEAYPLVSSEQFESLPNARDYLLFDPAAGLNRFNFIADAFTSGASVYAPAQPTRFEVELMFSQRFRKVGDGITFDQVFTGSSEAPDPTNNGTLDRNPFRLSGSIGVALRRYKEGAGFKSVPMPEQQHYFPSEAKTIPYESRTEVTAAHWNIQRGMRPIVWKISPQVQRFAKDPRYSQYDVLGAIIKGVEAWNDVFGFRVFEAKLAGPNESAGDDDVNYIHFDIDNQFGFAFADWRTNPNTGEIRGASVYISSLFVEGPDQVFVDDMPGMPTFPKTATLPPRPKVPTLSWNGMGGKPLCALDIREMMKTASRTRVATAAQPLTKKEKVELYFEHVMQHEIGHDLGLRHNFKGSLVPPTTSVMEYTAFDDVFTSTIATRTYDKAVIQYLYGLKSTLPTEPFCTDESYGVEPRCDVFDSRADPLVQFYAPPYAAAVADLLSGKTADLNEDPNFAFNLDGILSYVRAGFDSPERMRGFDIATNGVAVPLTAANAGNATYAKAADLILRNVMARLYLGLAAEGLPPEIVSLFPIYFGDLSNMDAALVAKIVNQLKGVLQNTDRVRSFDSRRQAVDILKKMQTLDAYAVLTESRAKVNAELQTLMGNDALLAKDLLGRIDAATTPYFTK
jgi:hypothetical protein